MALKCWRKLNSKRRLLCSSPIICMRDKSRTLSPMFGRPLLKFMTPSFPLIAYKKCHESLLFELVGRDFLNLDRPCSRHCLCPEHRPLLSCSRHCEQVNVILSFANFEELLLNQGPENNNSETTGRWARGCCWNPHQVRHKTGERQLSQVGQMFWYFVEFVQNRKLFMDLFRLASSRIMVVQCGGWVLTNPMVAPLQKHQNGIHKWKRLFT